MNNYVTLAIGILCAGFGGELFVRGTVGLARWARISAGIIGATVAAFGTSSPELSVAINAALIGTPEISFGNVLGGNLLNVAVVLGFTLVLGSIHGSQSELRRDFRVALLVPVAIGILAFDGVLSRLDGFLLLAFFLFWLTTVFMEARRQRSVTEEVLGEHRRWLAVVSSLAGLVLLIAAGRLIITGAQGIAAVLGIDQFVVGVILVAIGTSAPELATTVIAKLRGHDEVGLGTIFGSNIFNGLFIVALVSIIHPIPVNWHEARVALLFGIVTVAMTWPSRQGIIQRWRGGVLLLLYALFFLITL
ncbi:MAG: calcium/sodium antiporter [Armatimonadota bacterium]